MTNFLEWGNMSLTSNVGALVKNIYQSVGDFQET